MGSESRLSNSNESGSEKEFSFYSKFFTAVVLTNFVELKFMKIYSLTQFAVKSHSLYKLPKVRKLSTQQKTRQT